MRTHYIPRLLLRQFAQNEKVNLFNVRENNIEMTKNIKKVFCEEDLYDEQLEHDFATKVEGPFGDLLNNKLLKGEWIRISREENMLIRKFALLSHLRSPLMQKSVDEIIEYAKLTNMPYVQVRQMLMEQNPHIENFFKKYEHQRESYIPDLKNCIQYSIEEILDPYVNTNSSMFLYNLAVISNSEMLAIWDCADTELEFILPQLQGITNEDYGGANHKYLVTCGIDWDDYLEKRGEGGTEFMLRMKLGSIACKANYSLYPLSPTRMLVCISPFFRGFFQEKDALCRRIGTGPLFPKEQFDRHFFYKERMENFKPCVSYMNRRYEYQVRHLTREETLRVNSLFLNGETDKFVFRDFNKLRESLWYYDNVSIMAYQRRNNYNKFE